MFFPLFLSGLAYIDLPSCSVYHMYSLIYSLTPYSLPFVLIDLVAPLLITIYTHRYTLYDLSSCLTYVLYDLPSRSVSLVNHLYSLFLDSFPVNQLYTFSLTLFTIQTHRPSLSLFILHILIIPFSPSLSLCSLIQRDTHPAPIINCRMMNSAGKHIRDASPAPDHRSEARLRIDPKVLVFVETTYSGLGRDIAELLVYNRIK